MEYVDDKKVNNGDGDWWQLFGHLVIDPISKARKYPSVTIGVLLLVEHNP